jgi:hypothetical protein
MNDLPLKDIHLSDTILWWPPAPGWWLIAVLIIGLMLLLPTFLRWLRYKPVRSLSLTELYLIRKNHQQQADQKKTLQAITTLLRRTVMSKSGRIGHAGVVGDDWLKQLNEMSDKDCFTQEQGELLKHGRYQPIIEGQLEGEIDSLLQSCEHWIRSLPKGGSHAAT